MKAKLSFERHSVSWVALVCAAFFLMWAPKAFATPTAAEVASQVTAKLKNTPGIKASFSLDVSGMKVSGNLLCSGKKFRLMSGGYSSWYDGKNLYTLNPRSKETTIVIPTSSELCEANPLFFLDGASSVYDLAFASHQPSGKYMLVLTPKRRGETIKSVFITIDRKSMLPENIVVTGSDGNVSSLTITSLQLNMKIGAGIFIYPKDKYAHYKLIDLR